MEAIISQPNVHLAYRVHYQWAYLLDNNQPKWILRGSYPATWMILCAVMLNTQFVGCMCGPYWHNIVPTHVLSTADQQAAEWFPRPSPKPPDPHDDTHPPSYEINMHKTVYSVSRSHVHKNGALVDRGANGGMAGADVRAICKTSQQVDVTGIDNHQVTDIPIITAGGVVTTQRGEVILIMNQYAHMPQACTIHSSAQMEAFGIQVDDRARANGGHQRIITPEGYVIPLQVRSGLIYMDMRPYTDAEFDGPNQLPHVILTSDQDWEPSSIDHEYDCDCWFEAMQDFPDIALDHPFDDYGEYIYRHELDASCAQVASTNDLETSILINAAEQIKTASNACCTALKSLDHHVYHSNLDDYHLM